MECANEPMKTRRFLRIILLLIVLLAMLVGIPNSPLYQVAERVLENRMETRWSCAIDREAFRIHPLKGIMAWDTLTLATSEEVNPMWRLTVGRLEVRLDPFLFIRDRRIPSVALEDLRFIRREKEHPPASTPEKSGTSPGTLKGSPPAPGTRDFKTIRIGRLVIRNGSFESSRVLPSGHQERTAAEHIFIVKREVPLAGRPDGFLRSVLMGADG